MGEPSGGDPAPRIVRTGRADFFDRLLGPGPQVLALSVAEDVDLDAQRHQLEPRDLAIDRLGHGMHARPELAGMAHEVLEDALERFDGTVIAVSHDRYFLDRIADRIVLVADGEVRSFEGGWSANADVLAD